MRAALIVVGVLFLGGCGYLDAIRGTVSTKGAEVNDQLLNDAEWFICYGASVGSVRRAYGTPGMSDIYRSLCDKDGDLLTPALDPVR